ncbi:reverse transcriptase family protein [Chitinophaga rhizophila]|uniref:RNA-directed DNA polymerase n=1 Tax=Chitinophaga rhizophila TaxID=2866212 RepID=A0ABS7GHM9_9BACT|nr:reverse transcriptase family protein [Chitinophaga rhizophila]MBW8686931.1 RNA-directed DNA polymerase [Chitinophaga rhizophila]
MAEGLTRQQLYDRIRASSKEEFILEEMTRLGFWTKNTAMPSPSEMLIRREGELRRELNKLMEEKHRYRHREQMLNEIRKQRMEAAKAKRAATKLRNEEKRKEKAAKWAIEKEKNIVYLGEEVSAGLNKVLSDEAKLRAAGLPIYHDGAALAEAMGITLGKLRFLSFDRKVATVTHYKRFYIPKKSGGRRLISAPMPQLKAAQYWILENILYKVKHSDAAHGFVPGKSIVTNAANHVGQDIVINIDLRDFFPTVAYNRVKGMFCNLGYSEQVSTILGLLCTEPEMEPVNLDGKDYHVATSARHLPQGAPCSPAITNIICYKLDRRFEGLARRFNYTYTRYADDMTFSAKEAAANDAGKLIWGVKQVVKEEGFVVHPDKLKVMRKGDKREVTGVVVNEKLSIDRETLRKFRALLHQISVSGIEGKQWGKGNIVSSIEGYINYVQMVKPEAGQQLKTKWQVLLGRTDIKSQTRASSTGQIVIPPVVPPAQDSGETGEKPWWDVM